MPIRPEWLKYYGREWRREIRPRILERAGNCCERCKVPNHATVFRRAGWWFDEALQIPRNETGKPRAGRAVVWVRRVRIVLTVAHLNHDPTDRRNRNLRALCQWCHLHHDAPFHAINARRTRQTRKDATRPLLVLLAS